MRGLNFFGCHIFWLTLHFWCVFFSFFAWLVAKGRLLAKLGSSLMKLAVAQTLDIYSAIQILTVAYRVVFLYPYTLSAHSFVILH